jgi:hypothetical protein
LPTRSGHATSVIPEAAQRLSAIHHETEQNVHAVGRIPGSHLSARPGMTRSSGRAVFAKLATAPREPFFLWPLLNAWFVVIAIAIIIGVSLAPGR